QMFVLFGKMFPFPLHGLSDRAKGDGAGQLLFASQDASANGFGIFSIGTQLEIMIIMIDRRGGIRVLLIEKTAEFEVSRSRFRIDLERSFERLDGHLEIQSVDTAFTGQKMRFLLLVELALARGEAAAQQKTN